MLTAVRKFFRWEPEEEPDFDITLDDITLDDITLDDEGFTIVDGDDFNLEDYLHIADGGDGGEINMRYPYQSSRKPLNFNRITDNIFLGSCPATEDDVTRLKAAGVTAVLNLQTDFDLTKKKVDWKQLIKYYESAGIIWKRNPTIDYNEKDLKRKVPLSLLWLEYYIKQGHVVYVHCNSGVNRSPTVVAAYLHLQGGSIQTAVNQVLARRPSWPDKEAISIGCKIYRRNKHKTMLSEEQKRQVIEKLSVDKNLGFNDVDTFIAHCREVLIEEIEGGML